MLKKVNFSLLAFLSFLGKILVSPCSIGDAFAIIGLAALYAYSLYLESKKELPINESLKRDLIELKGAISALKIGKTYSKL